MNKQFKSAKDRIILSLDVDDFEQVTDLVKKLKNYVGTFKIGMYQFPILVPQMIKLIQDEGARVYFDGKFHDIPNTVAKAGVSLLDQRIDFFSVHTSGGSKMIKACVEACHKRAEELNVEPPIILGETVLTSIGQRTLKNELGLSENTQDVCLRLAKIAKNSGLNGIIASACEAKYIRKKLGEDFIILTPAIRPTWSKIYDQLRVLSPKEAIDSGSDYLLIGRPITQAKDPVSAIKLIIDEIEEAIEGIE